MYSRQTRDFLQKSLTGRQTITSNRSLPLQPDVERLIGLRQGIKHLRQVREAEGGAGLPRFGKLSLLLVPGRFDDAEDERATYRR
jgi:hypothetical protein